MERKTMLRFYPFLGLEDAMVQEVRELIYRLRSGNKILILRALSEGYIWVDKYASFEGFTEEKYWLRKDCYDTLQESLVLCLFHSDGVLVAEEKHCVLELLLHIPELPGKKMAMILRHCLITDLPWMANSIMPYILKNNSIIVERCLAAMRANVEHTQDVYKRRRGLALSCFPLYRVNDFDKAEEAIRVMRMRYAT